MYKPLSLVALV